MPEADAKQATAAPRLLVNLPPAEQSAAAIREAARHLGLLLDLHRVTARLRDLESKPAHPSS
jgi:hypothetical protein